MSQAPYYGQQQPPGPGLGQYNQYPPQQQHQQQYQQYPPQQQPPPQGQYGGAGYPPNPAQGQYPPPAQGQYPPSPQPPHGGHSPQPPQQYGAYAPPGAPGQQPPAGQYGQYPPPQGQQPGQYGQQQFPPQQQQQGQYGAQPGGQYGQPGQYGQQQPPPQGQYGQPQGQYPPQNQQPGQYGQYPPQSGPYGQQQQPPPGGHSPAPYGQQQSGYAPPQQGYPPQGQYGAPVPGQYGGGYKYSKPASFGYDITRRTTITGLNTSADVEALRKAMKGMGCDERALIKVLTKREYANPFAMRQLVEDYNKRFLRDLAKDIESETRGDFETALLALIRGPLELDARVLNKALVRAGTDEEALMDVLLSRSNADISAIIAEYRRLFGHELLADIKDDVDDEMYRFWSMVLSATRQEDPDETTPIPPHREDIRSKTVEMQHATEGTGNAIAVARILTSSSDAQIRAIAESFRTNYKATLEDVIEREFRGDMEDALLRMLTNAQDRARADAKRLESPLYKSPRKDRLFINRLVSLYWDQPRLQAAAAAFAKHSRGRIALRSAVKAILSSDYEDVVVALIEPKI